MHLAPDASLIDDSDNNHLAIDLVAVAKTSEGKLVENPTDKKIEAHLSAEKMAAVRQNGVAFKGSMDLAPGEYTIRFVVRDNLSGRVGSVAAPLRVE
jgi:fibronectin type 3 domain-containing protein